jgi:predicted RNA-binding Zn-ribbon protein involved in translation (DUF1610 family)
MSFHLAIDSGRRDIVGGVIFVCPECTGDLVKVGKCRGGCDGYECQFCGEEFRRGSYLLERLP